MTEPIYPKNPVANMAEFVKQHNQTGGRSLPNPEVPRLDPEPFPDVSPVPAHFDEPTTTQARHAPPVGPLSVDSIVFQEGKAHLVMTDGSSHEMPQPLSQAAVQIALKSWEAATFSKMGKFGELFGVKVHMAQGEPEPATNGQGESQTNEVPKPIARRGRPPRKA